MEEDQELLREACAVGNKVAAEFYIRKGVSINCQHKISKFTPLHWAYSRNQEDIIALLRKYGADETLLDAKGRRPNECKPIEFQPNYIKNPDLNKLWGIPDSRESVQEVAKVKKHQSQSKNLPAQDNLNGLGKTISQKSLQILVFMSSKEQKNLKGAVFINQTVTIEELKELVIRELDGIPELFDIARIYDQFVVPVTLKQMGHNAHTHFSRSVGDFKNSADLIVIPSSTD